MKSGTMMALAMSGLALGGWAATAAARPDDPPQHSSQQQFDEAVNAAVSGDCKAAIPKFVALEQTGRFKAGSLAAAAITLRKGICQAREGRTDRDEAAMRSALARLEGAEFDSEVSDGWMTIGRSALQRDDFGDAAASFRQALARVKGADRLDGLAGLAKATAFDSTSEAADAATEAITILGTTPAPSNDMLAAYYTLRGRALLNRGMKQEAYKDLLQALSLSGGLTLNTSLADVAIRSDLAMAAMLVGRTDQAKQYLAYTGAGRFDRQSFTPGAGTNPPMCGEDAGLRPQDVAVVELSIAEDGSVSSAHTVYSEGGPAVAAAFARSIRDWHWSPDIIAKIPPFYRALTRLEVRCSNAMNSGRGIIPHSPSKSLISLS